MLINKNKGFTLIELVLYVAISAILLILTGGVIIEVLAFQAKANAIESVADNARAIFSRIEEITTDASSINSPYPGSYSPTLDLSMMTLENDPTIIDVSDLKRVMVKQGWWWSEYVYYLSDNNVQIKELSFFNATPPGGSYIFSVKLTVAATSFSPLREYNYEQTFYSTFHFKK
ncbi:MAG: type II secretion system protein [Patescibacteria group bacterium]|nr:type II secretion system protein [Patescibacteria group bacterium]